MSTAQKRAVTGTITAKPAAEKRGVSVKSISRSMYSHSQYYETLMKSVKDSKQLLDPFLSEYRQDSPTAQAIQPIYDFDKLISISLESSMLRPCIDAYVVNIEAYGHEIEYVGKREEALSPEVTAERTRLDAIMARMFCYNTLPELREKSRVDYEILGNRAFEIVRNDAGEVTQFNVLPFASMRATRYHEDPVDVYMKIPNPSAADGYEEVSVVKHFRRFLQKNTTNGRIVYFKEFGDPRVMSSKTGIFETADHRVPDDEIATEVLMDAQYVPASVYGVPRWIGQVTAILGSREAELVNYEFFKDNAIPALAVLVSGGALTKDAVDQLTSYIGGSRGRKSMNRVLILEALADDSAGGSTDHSVAAPKMEMKPMISERQQDGLFQEYDEKNALKVRSAFRLSAIYTGRTDDYNRASAYASMQVAENQIFVPERMRFDAIMNDKILATHGIKYHKFRSLGAPLSDPESLSRILRALDDTGALTPNTIIKIANQILNVDVADIQEEWGNVPFQVIMGFVRQGIIPTGFEDYVSKLNETMGPLAQAPNPPAQNGLSDPAKDEVKKLVSAILDDLNLQTFANNGE